MYVLRHPLFSSFIVEFRFLILRRSFEERKKTAKLKLEKESGARRSGTSCSEEVPQHNIQRA